MKKLLLLLLLTSVCYSQHLDTYIHSDTLIGGTDTLCVDTLSNRYLYVIITVSDTGSTYTDSVIVEEYDKVTASWVQLDVIDLGDHTDYTLCSPGAGATHKYLIYNPSCDIIRQRLSNATFVNGRRVLTTLKATNY